jgi:membrane protein
VIGLVLFAAAFLSVASTSAVDWFTSFLGGGFRDWSRPLVTVVSLLVVYLIDAAALGVLFRFLADARLTLRRMLGGTLLGGAALLGLQLLGSTLLGGASRNPLLSTFVVFIALLLWFRLTSVVTLVAAAWIAVATEDHGGTLYEPSAAEKAALEHEALLIAAEVRLRDAQRELDGAGWWHRAAARWRRNAAVEELRSLESARPTAGLPASRASGAED